MNEFHAICVAYGPSESTSRSLAELRSLGASSLVVYPGTQAGLDAVLALGQRDDLEAIHEIGRHGLREALGHLRDVRQILFIHDDVRIGSASLRALREAARRLGTITVPFSNDQGTDHYVGPLPASTTSSISLDERRVAEPPRVAHVVRPSCLVATPQQLAGLFVFHPSYPASILQSTQDDVHAVPNAVAAHDGTCMERLAEPKGPDGQPLLVASMIVRDEEALLPDCLASLAGIVDRIDLCDTGSTDRTVDIARDFGANVIQRTWRNDFGWARNEALEASADAWWALWIDADERLDVTDPEHLRRTLATAAHEYDVIRIPLEDQSNSQGTSTFRWLSPRIISPRATRFHGALHERVLARGQARLAMTSYEDVRLIHIGYSNELIASRNKTERNLSIAEEAFANDPSADNALHYARSLRLAGRPATEQIPPLELALEQSDTALPAGRAYIMAMLAIALLDVGEDDERALNLAREAIELVPAEDTAALAFAEAAQRLDRPEEILWMAEHRRRARSLAPTMSMLGQQGEAASKEVTALTQLGRHDEAWEAARRILVSHPSGFSAWGDLIETMEIRDAQDLDPLLDLAMLADAPGPFRALARRAKPSIVAAFCARYVRLNGRDLDAIRVGLTAAMVARSWDDFDRIVPLTDGLPDDDRRSLAGRLREHGFEDQARRLWPT